MITTRNYSNVAAFMVGEKLSLTEGIYRVESLSVCRAISLPTDEPYEDGLRRVQLLIHGIVPGQTPEQEAKFTFTAAPGQDNIWKLEIPEEAWKHEIERQKKKQKIPHQ